MAIDDATSVFTTREWTLKRNCSLSPRQFASLLGSLAVVSIGFGSVFAWAGAWWILVFSVVEVAALVAAFVAYARHAGDYERVVLTPDALIIEFNTANRIHRQVAHPAFARVVYPRPGPGPGPGGDSLIALAVSGKAVEVGRFVPRLKRESLAREIRTHLLAAGNASWR
ncbi:MAG: DUF2244 domain-containing protein [Lautropia sp.]